MNVVDIINGCRAEGRFGFEEVVWLLIFGKLPDERQYNRICQLLYENRELPEYFPEAVSYTHLDVYKRQVLEWQSAEIL